MSEEIKRRPYLQLGQLRTELYAYRIVDSGIFFIEAQDDHTSGGQVNFITNGIILNVAGKEFRNHEIGKLLAENAVDSIWSAADA